MSGTICVTATIHWYCVAVIKEDILCRRRNCRSVNISMWNSVRLPIDSISGYICYTNGCDLLYFGIFGSLYIGTVLHIFWHPTYVPANIFRHAMCLSINIFWHPTNAKIHMFWHPMYVPINVFRHCTYCCINVFWHPTKAYIHILWHPTYVPVHIFRHCTYVSINIL